MSIARTSPIIALAALVCAGPAHGDPLSDFLRFIFAPAPAHAPLKRAARSVKAPKAAPAAALPAGFIPMSASFYGGGADARELSAFTASGERFDPPALTAAHRSFPFGTLLDVCFARCAVVRVNDRGPAAWTGRALDLSRGAAKATGLLAPGVGFVRVKIIGRKS